MRWSRASRATDPELSRSALRGRKKYRRLRLLAAADPDKASGSGSWSGGQAKKRASRPACRRLVRTRSSPCVANATATFSCEPAAK